VNLPYFKRRLGAFTRLVCVLFVTACAAPAQPPIVPNAAAQAAIERENVRDTVVGVVHDIDAKRWQELRARFGERVRTDYTSLFGGTAQTQTGDALIASWRGALGNVATQHLLGPIHVRLAGDRAHAECHVRGMHQSPRAASGANWEVLGHYIFELARAPSGAWSIDALTIVTQAQIGNTKLLAESSATP
jgi:hypothetical protein